MKTVLSVLGMLSAAQGMKEEDRVDGRALPGWKCMAMVPEFARAAGLPLSGSLSLSPSLSPPVFLCLPACLPACLPVCLSACLSVRPSIRPSVRLSGD